MIEDQKKFGYVSTLLSITHFTRSKVFQGVNCNIFRL